MKKQFLALVSFVLAVVFVAEMIGMKFVTIGNITVTLLPLVFAVSIAMILGIPAFRKGPLKKVFTDNNVNFSGKYLGIIMLPLMARYGADIAPKLKDILSVGYIFIFQEIGNVGTVLLGLPVAIMLGLKREAIGATLGIGREGELSYISGKYGLNSAEGRGVLSMYLIGTLFGSIFFSLLSPLLLAMGLDYRAIAMASGVGSSSMMAAASSSLVGMLPDKESTITAYAASSTLLSSFLGTYTMLFLAEPLQTKLYNLLNKGKEELKHDKDLLEKRISTRSLGAAHLGDDVV